MKLNITSLFATLLLTAASLTAADAPQAKPGSKEFEQMKTLVGTWTGKVDYGQGLTDSVIQYRLIAGGSVLEERIAAGTPMEMVSMYYDKAGKLAMTHYCVMGNRPEMALKSSDAKSITFNLDAACCTFDTKKESHMSGVTIKFDDADTFTSSCKAVLDGKEVPEHLITFKRVKNATASAK
jgi:hypothetical protein